jgi:hypothetical protein
MKPSATSVSPVSATSADDPPTELRGVLTSVSSLTRLASTLPTVLVPLSLTRVCGPATRSL